MPARSLATATALAAATLLVGGSALLAQESLAPDASPGAVGSPAASSPMPVASPVAISPGGSPGAATVVGVTLQDGVVTPDLTTIPAGPVTLQVANTSAGLVHEFVIVRTDLAADALPTLEDGSFDESGEGVEIVGEIEAIDPGASATLDVILPAGHYVFLCNIVSEADGQPFSHFAAGMRTDIEIVDAAMGSAAPESPAVAPGMSMAPASAAPMASEPAAPAASPAT